MYSSEAIRKGDNLVRRALQSSVCGHNNGL
jgi:hypothetical protein